MIYVRHEIVNKAVELAGIKYNDFYMKSNYNLNNDIELNFVISDNKGLTSSEKLFLLEELFVELIMIFI